MKVLILMGLLGLSALSISGCGAAADAIGASADVCVPYPATAKCSSYGQCSNTSTGYYYANGVHYSFNVNNISQMQTAAQNAVNACL